MDPRNSEVSGVILSIILPVSSLNISCVSSTAYEGLWAKITARYRLQACIQASKEVILLISGGLYNDTGTSNISENLALCNNIAKSTYSPCSICCHSCTGIGGDVNWLGGMYADGTLAVWFPARTNGNEKLCG